MKHNDISLTHCNDIRASTSAAHENMCCGIASTRLAHADDAFTRYQPVTRIQQYAMRYKHITSRYNVQPHTPAAPPLCTITCVTQRPTSTLVRPTAPRTRRRGHSRCRAGRRNRWLRCAGMEGRKRSRRKRRRRKKKKAAGCCQLRQRQYRFQDGGALVEPGTHRRHFMLLTKL